MRNLPVGKIIEFGVEKHGLNENALKKTAVEFFHDAEQGLYVSDIIIVRTLFQRAEEMDAVDDVSLAPEIADYQKQYSLRGRFKHWLKTGKWGA